jgi:hypothetical protein
VEPLGLDQAAQAVHAQVAEVGRLGQGLLDQGPGGVGHDHLPAVARVGDPGRPVHVQAGVVVPAPGALAGVQAHPDPQRVAGRPVVGGQGPLGRQRRPHRRGRAGEDHEEGVSVGADLDPAGLGDGLAEDGRVLVEDGRVPVAEGLEQAGRALDVGEQEGHRAHGQVVHVVELYAACR